MAVELVECDAAELIVVDLKDVYDALYLIIMIETKDLI